MPAPAEYQNQTGSITTGQAVFNQMKAIIAQTAYQKMVDYNPIGSGTFGGTYEWTCPENKTFIFSAGAGELSIDSTPYSSLGADMKEIFHRWLPQFTKRFILRYNLEYNI